MKKKAVKWIIAVLLIPVLLFGGCCAWFQFHYYHADDTAMAIAETAEYDSENRMFVLEPENPNGIGLVFYPGAQVQAEAYFPLLNRLRENGITVAVVKLPLHMAFFDSNAAERVMNALPDITCWYVGGHSLGGAIAAGWSAEHQDAIAGTILLAANLYKNCPADRSLLVYGTLDTTAAGYAEEAVHVCAIEGGNHAQFGNYGAQHGDAEALISREAQQEIAADAILEFMNENSLK